MPPTRRAAATSRLAPRVRQQWRSTAVRCGSSANGIDFASIGDRLDIFCSLGCNCSAFTSQPSASIMRHRALLETTSFPVSRRMGCPCALLFGSRPITEASAFKGLDRCCPAARGTRIARGFDEADDHNVETCRGDLARGRTVWTRGHALEEAPGRIHVRETPEYTSRLFLSSDWIAFRVPANHASRRRASRVFTAADRGRPDDHAPPRRAGCGGDSHCAG